MSHNVDLRIQRTLILIRDAFVELLVEQGFETITVRAITQRAQINRATFYRHYKDKYELAERLTETLFQDVIIEAANQPPSPESWRVLFDHVAQYAPFYRAMLGAGGIPGFNDRVRQSVEEQMMTLLSAAGMDVSKRRVPLAVSVRYMAAAQVGLIQWWLENEMPVSAQEAAGYLLQLHERGGLWGVGLV